MFGLFFRAEAAPGKFDQLTDFLRQDGEFCRDMEPNTLRFEFYKDPNDDAVYVYEAYRDERCFEEEHKKNPPFQVWLSGLKEGLWTMDPKEPIMKGDALWSYDRSVAKDRIELLLKLADAAWRDYSERRLIEWKVNFALWSALGIFGGFLLQQNVQLHTLVAVVVSALLISTVVVYTFFKLEIQKRNGLDVDAAQFYWTQVDKELSMQSPEARKEKKSPKAGLRPTHLSQVIITSLFVVIVIFAVWTQAAT